MPRAKLTAGWSPATVLALQRSAGNAATVAALRGDIAAPRLGASQILARCSGPCACSGRCDAHDASIEDETQGVALGDRRRDLQRSAANATGGQLLARAVSERQGDAVGAPPPLSRRTLQRMAPCPASLAGSDPPPAGWKPYPHDTDWFHCGFRGILEDRAPTRSDPMNECFYDHSGRLVDGSHPQADCGGTPDQYDASQGWWDATLHALIDSGGIVRAGGPAFVESTAHAARSLNSWYARARARFLYGAP